MAAFEKYKAGPAKTISASVSCGITIFKSNIMSDWKPDYEEEESAPVYDQDEEVPPPPEYEDNSVDVAFEPNEPDDIVGVIIGN
ncbi:hypothetical protein F4808DRAFT_455653 [Astrocystis sublimbata]|nr:hypothetical protein F4808DRAFT_455653 [Astrocystis sublimbata]